MTAGTTPERQPARLAFLVALTVFAHTAFNGSRVTVSLYALSLQSTPLTVGVLVSLYSLLPMFLSVSAGRMVDRVGPARPLLWSAAAIAFGVGLPFVVTGLPALYIACAVIGLAFMVFHIAVQSAVGALSDPSERAVNFSWLALGFSISGFLGPTTAGLAIDFVGHRATFGILAAFAVVAALALAIVKPRIPRAQAGKAPGGDLAGLLESAQLRRVFLVTGILAMAWDLFYFVMPIYGTSIGLTASTIGAILGSFALATFVVRLFLPWMARRLREWQLVTATLFIASHRLCALSARADGAAHRRHRLPAGPRAGRVAAEPHVPHPARDPCRAAGRGARRAHHGHEHEPHFAAPAVRGRGHGAGDGAGVLGHGCFPRRHRRVCEAPSRGTVSSLPRKPA